VGDQGTVTRTSSLSGAFKAGPLRTEFMAAIPTPDRLKIG